MGGASFGGAGGLGGAAAAPAGAAGAAGFAGAGGAAGVAGLPAPALALAAPSAEADFSPCAEPDLSAEADSFPCAKADCLSSGSLGMFQRFRKAAGAARSSLRAQTRQPKTQKLYFLTHAAQLRNAFCHETKEETRSETGVENLLVAGPFLGSRPTRARLCGKARRNRLRGCPGKQTSNTWRKAAS